MEWINIGIIIIINLFLFVYGYGKLTSYAEKNRQDIREIKDNCSTYRKNCHDDSIRVDGSLFEKIEELKNFVNSEFKKLAIQIAKLEK